MPRNYITSQGDMWDAISWNLLGSEYYMDLLIAANPEHKEMVIFPANIQLIIPDVDTSQIPEHLPPWKREGDEET
ncbi:tail protein X [Brevibacillus laterosporus]|uniref:tail protein X n=1 Tax=Brevibacillus laterosporus TaxID=1465 RepID=UPI003D256190